MFVETSALISMLTDEDEARLLGSRLQQSKTRITSPLVIWSATDKLARHHHWSIQEAQGFVAELVDLANIQILAVPPKASVMALDALERYGQGRHPAALDFEDCMAYACARYYRQPMLFNSGKLSKTDIEPA